MSESSFNTPAGYLDDIYLKTPDLSDKNIIGYGVGVRPYRKSGVRIEPEYVKEKLIIHNYGYGGSGLTLCWGGAKEAVSMLKEEQEKNSALSQVKTVAILGAGVIGLATAYDLLAEGYAVNIYADAFSPNLTSNIAAGILSAPTDLDHVSDEQKKLLNKILKASMQRFQLSATSSNPEFSGIKYLTDYRFESPTSDALSSKFKGLSTDEKMVRVHFDNGIIKTARQIRELGLDGKLFIEDLYRQVQAKGALIRHRYFENIASIEKCDEAIIINCTSMGSRALFNDHDLIPIRGHLIYLKPQEGINYAMYQPIPHSTDYWVKLYPWSDRLILGGVFEKGKEECSVDHDVINKLLNYARDCFTIANGC